MKKYIHKEVRIGWLRFSVYILGKRFTVRIELSSGWD
jgi:hypothetical protein